MTCLLRIFSFKRIYPFHVSPPYNYSLYSEYISYQSIFPQAFPLQRPFFSFKYFPLQVNLPFSLFCCSSELRISHSEYNIIHRFSLNDKLSTVSFTLHSISISKIRFLKNIFSLESFFLLWSILPHEYQIYFSRKWFSPKIIDFPENNSLSHNISLNPIHQHMPWHRVYFMGCFKRKI